MRGSPLSPRLDVVAVFAWPRPRAWAGAHPNSGLSGFGWAARRVTPPGGRRRVF
jgi:hypothetical protein